MTKPIRIPTDINIITNKLSFFAESWATFVVSLLESWLFVVEVLDVSGRFSLLMVLFEYALDELVLGVNKVLVEKLFELVGGEELTTVVLYTKSVEVSFEAALLNKMLVEAISIELVVVKVLSRAGEIEVETVLFIATSGVEALLVSKKVDKVLESLNEGTFSAVVVIEIFSETGLVFDCVIRISLVTVIWLVVASLSECHLFELSLW